MIQTTYQLFWISYRRANPSLEKYDMSSNNEVCHPYNSSNTCLRQ